MCNQFTFHHQFGIDTGRSKFERQTDRIFLPVDPMDKNHKDPDTIDLSVPRHAQYLHKAWKKHQNTVYWVDINLALKKGLKFYQTRSNEIILYDTIPAYCIPKVVRMETEETIYDKTYASPRPPPKIFFKDNWKKKLGSEFAGGGKDSPQTQPKTKNLMVRTGRLVWAEQPSGSSAQEIDKGVLFGCESTKVRTVRLVNSCRSGKPEERDSSNAQIRTPLEERRQTILADCNARVSQHELQAAQAEEERRLLQGQLWQQKLEFREAHQRSLTEMEELRKFQSSTFDTIARRKLVED